ncbi:MAG: hypothetical protein ACREMQ_00465 [Longimicrobiales bacterium]
MPSINTLVADLNSGSIVGVAQKPDSNNTTGSGTLSGTHLLKYLFTDMAATLTASNRLSCPEATAGSATNGRYLHFQDSHGTVAKVSISHPVVASGNFSGCAYKVYKDGGDIYCVHIARPGGKGSDANVNLADDYAKQKGWTELQHIPTVGNIGTNGCSEVWVVSQLLGNRLDSIRLNVSSAGMIVGKSAIYSANV